MIARLLLTVAAFFAFGASLIAISHYRHEESSARRREDWLKYGVYLGIITALLTVAYMSRWLLGVVLFPIVVTAFFEISRNINGRSSLKVWIAATIALFVTACLVHLMLGGGRDWFATFAYVFLLVSISDSFSQLWGRLLGRHKLCPRLSPGKTKEGLAGGIISCVAGALILSPLFPGTALFRVALMGLVVAVAATCGDLLFSFVKRKLGIKDFSHILPGHGGVLDRFDSLIVAAPVSYWVGKILIN